MKNTDNRGFPLKVFTSYKESVSFLGIRKTAADKNENNRMICKTVNIRRTEKMRSEGGANSDVHRIRRKKRDDKNDQTETRLEADSIGTMEVPAEAYYGVQALRAKQNFPITGTKLHPVFIRNLAQIKKAAAITNNNAGLLPEDKADAIVRACDEVIAGKLAEEFIVDAIQGGAGTSANMNMNEVIANRAGEILGCPKGSYKMVHPNDHVNMAQSTNDVIPTAGKLTVLDLLAPLEKALVRLEKELAKRQSSSMM